ncbi:3-oxoacyl-ACP reductase FabG [Buchnera aphidicola]|uniref:3-oxoacyl-ACP reductase FabG n=1 Tax=Buchnera aphidicola TaxID=9 RepID=UPI003464AA9E
MKNKKKIALVTGANRGIGQEIAKKLSKNNIIVIGTAKNLIEKNKINSMLGKNGFGIILDVTNKLEISQSVQKIHNNFGIIDILINNAAIKYDKLLIQMSDHDWNKTLKTNLTSIFHISKAVIKKMIQQKYGRIITIGSVIGELGNIGQINYSTSKSGIIGFNKTLALEVADKGITANVISPGLINTDMINDISLEKKKKYLLNIPMKKFGSKKHIASMVLYLISKSAAYITGQTIHINGGMYMN